MPRNKPSDERLDLVDQVDEVTQLREVSAKAHPDLREQAPAAIAKQ